VQVEVVPSGGWNFISTRHQWYDDEVHIKERRHSITLGHPQRHMRTTLIMMLYHRQGIHTWILLAYNKGWRDGDHH
jgi:hypothetical protein